MSQALYLDETFLFTCEATVLQVGQDANGEFIVLNQTIFYPQGGGQPSDWGALLISTELFEVRLVRQIEGQIRHYGAGPKPDWVGQSVQCKIDQKRRILNARYHTGAHFLSNVIEKAFPGLQAVKAHSFPGEAYVECVGSMDADVAGIQAHVDAHLETPLPVKVFTLSVAEYEKAFGSIPDYIPKEKAFRACQIGTMPPIPCGGTHLSDTSQLGRTLIRKVAKKADRMKVSYALAEG